MAEPFIGEIRLFPYSYAPVGWANCDGQILRTEQQQALFSLLGNRYGGDGSQTFALPDLRGRVPIHMGQGPGLSNRILADRVGTEGVTLNTDTMPQHSHNLVCTSAAADQTSPVGAIPAQGPIAIYSSSLNITREMVPGMIDNAGANQAHDNMMPFLVLRYCISLRGIYPPRN